MSATTEYKKLIDNDDEDVEVQETHAKAVPTRPPRAPRRGIPCCCKCLLITVALFLSMVIVLSAMSYMWMKDIVHHLTVTTPHEKFPIVTMSENELAVVKDRMALFVDELTAGMPTTLPQLEITQDEINAFIGHSDYLRGNMFVTLEKNLIKEEYSLPTDQAPGGKGRFYAGSDYISINPTAGELEVESETVAKHMDWFDGPLLFGKVQYIAKNHDDGPTLLEMYLEKGSFFGQDASQDFIDQKVNLLEDFYNNDDPDNVDSITLVEGIESVSIEKGKIIFKPRRHVAPGGVRKLKRTVPSANFGSAHFGSRILRKLF
jgi:hypothetical protein